MHFLFTWRAHSLQHIGSLCLLKCVLCMCIAVHLTNTNCGACSLSKKCSTAGCWRVSATVHREGSNPCSTLPAHVDVLPPAVARCAIIWSAALLRSSRMAGLFFGLRFSTKSWGVRPSVVRTNTSAPASTRSCTTGTAALSTAQCRGE